MARIPILRPGEHRGRGPVVKLAAADLADIAATYDPATHEAPLVIGHPKDGAEAHGWVRSLSMDGDILVAHADTVSADLAEMWKAQKVKKVSASLWLPDSQSNPTPGRWGLRHVGMLGAQVPAVKGLPPAELAAGDDDAWVSVDFADHALAARDMRIAALEEELEQRDAHAAKQEAMALVDELLEEGKLLPRQRDMMVAALMLIPEMEVVEYAEAEGGKVDLGEEFRTFLRAMPKQVEFREIAGGALPDADGAEGFSAPAGFAVDGSNKALHDKVVSLSEREGLSYDDALVKLTR